MWKHPHVVFIHFCENHDPRAKVGYNQGIFTYAYLDLETSFKIFPKKPLA